MDQETEEHWRVLSEQILTDVKEWRRAHPKATLREIEEEIHARMSRPEAQLIEDTAQESKSRAWSASSPEERPRCPICHSPLQARGKRQRKLQAVSTSAESWLMRLFGEPPNLHVRWSSF